MAQSETMTHKRTTVERRLTAIPSDIYKVIALRQAIETAKRMDKGISVGNAKPNFEITVYQLIRETEFYKQYNSEG